MIDELNSAVLISALVAGLLSVFVLILPFALYAKEANSTQQGKSWMEVISGTIFIHLAVTCFLAGLIALTNLATKDLAPAYSLKNGTSLFFGYVNLSSGNITAHQVSPHTQFWGSVISKIKTAHDSASDEISRAGIEAAGNIAVIVSLAHTGIYFLLLSVPLFALLVPIFLAFRRDSTQYEKSSIDQAYHAFLYIIATCLIIFLHSAIASAFVVFSTSAEFSWLEQMQAAWREIFENLHRN